MLARRQRFTHIGLSNPPIDARHPVAVETTDPRLNPTNIARTAVSIWRWGVELAGVTDPPCVEYLVPDLLIQSPSWAIQVEWNHVLLSNVDSEAPLPGQVYIYRTDDDPPQQRLRLGRAPDPGDRIIAVYYVIDEGAA